MPCKVLCNPLVYQPVFTVKANLSKSLMMVLSRIEPHDFFAVGPLIADHCPLGLVAEPVFNTLHCPLI